jgi:NADH pyrophosphatase NudC (nudix superfamily)
VLCHMEFNRFEVHIDDQDAGDIKLQLSDDLIEVKWFSKEELPLVKQIPGGKEFFEEMGYISKN